MRTRIFFPLLTILLLLMSGVGVRSVESEENPYNTTLFINTKTHGFWPDCHDDEIVFLSGITQNEELLVGVWIMNSTGPKRLLFANDSIDHTFSGPKLSPDGNTIVFTKLRIIIPSEKTELSIEILEKNGTQWNHNCNNITIYKRPKNLLNNPSFSPDGKRIIYFSNEAGGDGDVWIMDIDSSNRTQLTFDKKGSTHPVFSPDGTKIVYRTWSERGETEIWIMDSDGTNRKRILDDSWYPDHPTFMPDGKILFDSAKVSPHSTMVGAPSIWMMEQDGSNKTLLAPAIISHVGSERPSINRNGTRIAFEHGVGDNFFIHYVDDPDGDGIWEDSDGDHVADVCDGYPLDPERGYRTDVWEEEEDFLSGFGVTMLLSSVFIVVPAARRWRRRQLFFFDTD